jgi:hypothetical protein
MRLEAPASITLLRAMLTPKISSKVTVTELTQ